RGGSCIDSQAAVNCDEAWLFFVIPPAPDTWFEATVPFAALSRPHGLSPVKGNIVGGSATWHPTKLVDVKFTALSVLGAVAPFELWIDDVRFFNCSGADCVPTCGDPERSTACPTVHGIPAGCWPTGTDCSARSRFVG